jgi:hypothetical protein
MAKHDDVTNNDLFANNTIPDDVFDKLETIDNNAVYSVDFCNTAKKLNKSIKLELGKIEKSFLKISVNLYWINVNKAYEIIGGYDNISEYAEIELGIKKTTCYNLISIAERFGLRDEKSNVLSIDDKYKDYTVSQLTAMQSLTDDEIINISPSMTVKDIKKFVKECENDSTAVDDDVNNCLNSIVDNIGKTNDNEGPAPVPDVESSPSGVHTVELLSDNKRNSFIELFDNENGSVDLILDLIDKALKEHNLIYFKSLSINLNY